MKLFGEMTLEIWIGEGVINETGCGSEVWFYGRGLVNKTFQWAIWGEPLEVYTMGLG